MLALPYSSGLKISTRLSRPDDAAAVSDVLNGSYPRLMSSAYEAHLLIRAMPALTQPNTALLASGTYHVAEVDGAIVGCGGWSRERPGSQDVKPGVAHLRHFATSAEWVGRGIGRLIYNVCEAQAHSAEIGAFECYASLNAVRFYESLGFVIVNEISVPLGNNVSLPGIVMIRSLFT
jgi:GNAT superfamily N-acetyltransferase